MTIQIIGAGMARTGTLSTKQALEELGFSRCYHMIELLTHPEHVSHWEAAARGAPVDWDALFAGYQATVDYPGFPYYRQLMERYPEAKVLLNVRDAESWYESVRATIYQVAPSTMQKVLMSLKLPFSRRLRRMVRIFRMGKSVMWQGLFGGRFEDREHAIAVYNRHNEEVQRIVPPERLLVYQVKEGWEPLCRFLGAPVPDKPFPRLNDRDTFRERLKQGPFPSSGPLEP
jgi:hypothetical protein